MTRETRPIPTAVDVCDLCNEIIPAGHASERGSITGGFLAHEVETPQIKRAWLLWPPSERLRRASWQEKNTPEMKRRQYDFHADCILALVESNLATPTPKEKTP